MHDLCANNIFHIIYLGTYNIFSDGLVNNIIEFIATLLNKEISVIDDELINK